MARSIDADEFERFLMNLPDEVLCEDCCYVVVNEMRKQPTIEAEPVKQEWISVKDRLPKCSGAYIVCDENGDCFITGFDEICGEFGEWHGRYDSYTLGFLDNDWCPCEGITHWMPLPEPPKEEE